MAVYVPKPDAGPVDDLIEQLAAEVAARYAVAEELMISAVAEKVRKGIDEGTLESMTFRARALSDLRVDAERIVAGIKGSDLAKQVMHIAQTEGTAAAVERLGLLGPVSGGSGLTVNSTSAVAQMTLELSSAFATMERRMSRWMPDIYQRATAIAATNVLLGVETLGAAQKRNIEYLLARGVTGFTDTAGRRWTPGAYAEMSTRTSVNRAWQESNLDRLAVAGHDLVSLIGGVDACKFCAPWFGKVLSRDGATPAGTHMMKSATGPGMVSITVHGTLAQARAAGWGHPNDRCVPVGVFPGLSIPTGTTYDPQAEADRDRMRQIERTIRNWKRREAAALDDASKFAARRKVRDWQKKAKAHVDSTGQLRKNYREQLSFSDGSRATRRPPRPIAVAPARAIGR